MKRSRNTITIRDVARKAGVGVGTVSRVLNGGAYVRSTTRDRVLGTIDRMGFRPNAQARRMSRRRAEMVCFLLSNRDFLHSFHARILQGVETYASTLKQHVVFAALHYRADTASDRIPLPPILQESGLVDGLILAGTIYPNFLGRIQKMDIPFVVFGNNVFGHKDQGNLDEVSFDEVKGEYEAAQYVIDHGHRLITFVGDIFYPWLKARQEGYEAALRASGLKPASLTTHHEASFAAYGEWAASQLLASTPRPTAILAGNDEIAYGLWRSFRRNGIRVPDDVSLVGFDDREEATLMDPPLTTVRVHKEEIGQALVKLLLEKLHQPDGPTRKLTLPTELVVRETVKQRVCD